MRYRIGSDNALTHRYRVELTVPAPAEGTLLLALPVWIPGSYLVREFSRQLQGLQGRQGRRALEVEQLDKHRWRLRGVVPGSAVVVRYEVYARDPSVRTAWLDAQRAFFNPTSLCLAVDGLRTAPHEISVERPAAGDPAGFAGWHVATALPPVRTDAQGFGTYRAADYDELADSPFEIGAFCDLSFSAGGVPHRFVVAGGWPSFDAERLLRDTRALCEAAIRMWHASDSAAAKARPPFSRYVFMLNVVDDGYGGLEHGASTALICKRSDLPRRGAAVQAEGYTTLLGLIAHEYFHAWNVKRLRPAEFTRYDYAREQYTPLLWFFEGFTSYYDDRLVRRAGLIDDASYLRLLGKTINQVLQTPGRHVQTVAQASFDAWVKYYRPDENTPSHTVSYYTKGALVALCLDLRLRQGGHGSLDDTMRALWQRCAGGPMREADLHAVLRAQCGRGAAPAVLADLHAWVHSTADLPLERLLTAQGVRVQRDAAPWAQRLGLRMADSGPAVVKAVLANGAAEAAGLCAGDELLGLETHEGAWRITRIDDLGAWLGPLPEPREVTLLVSRDKVLLRLRMTAPADGAETVWRLGAGTAADDAVKMKAWLAGA